MQENKRLKLDLKRDVQGASLIEYALLVSLISIAAIASISFVGLGAGKQFKDMGKTLNSASTNINNPGNSGGGGFKP